MSLLAGQVHYLSATTPSWIHDLRFSVYDVAGRCGAAPHGLIFGESAARLVGDLFNERALCAANRQS
jgi:hypothetical protein